MDAAVSRSVDPLAACPETTVTVPGAPFHWQGEVGCARRLHTEGVVARRQTGDEKGAVAAGSCVPGEIRHSGTNGDNHRGGYGFLRLPIDNGARNARCVRLRGHDL